MEKSYYIGLDMGTSSLGWAVTDEQYRIIRKKGKDMWGVRLFDEAETAASRRTMRVARRRRKRERARIGYLKELFADEIEKKDPGFYQRLDDSKYIDEDKETCQPFALFGGEDYTDRDYYKQYPTIFHLRKELIESEEPHDVRLVYLAILNMFKHRGHFLNANLGEDAKGSGLGNLQQYYQALREGAEKLLGLDFPDMETGEWLEGLLASRHYSKTGKQEKILEKSGISKTKEKAKAEIWKLICGMKGKLAVIFVNDAWDEENLKFSISFSEGNFDENCIKVEEMLGEESFEFFMLLKQIHDWGVMAGILQGEDRPYQYLSFARVAAYEKHREDLRILKKLYKDYGTPDQYDAMFRVMANNNYSAYVGSVNSDRQPKRRGGKRSPEVFFKNIKKAVENFPDTEEKDYVLGEIERDNFLPKQLTPSNGVIPNQVHSMELKEILRNAEKYLPFLKERDESGLTASERIVQIFEFQIPYYVGPFSPVVGEEQHYSKNVWSVRREKGKIYPWNFASKIDEKASAENFISRMVKHCTYISGENVLPKNSLLYEKFMVLNELNNLKINGERVSTELKQAIFNTLLKTEKRVTNKQLIDFLRVNGYVEPKDTPEIAGIDGGFVNRRINYMRFANLLGVETLTYDQEKMAEKIIFWATVYGDTKKFLREKVEEEYGNVLSREQIKRILGYKFKDWGRLSRSLLELEGADETTGEVATVIQRMWDDSYNLMELIGGGHFTYREEIEKRTSSIEKTLSEIEFEDLADLYVSAPVRRMIWQTILVLKEITEVMGYGPERVFVEMARDPNAEKVRTQSRRNKFALLYKNCKEEGRDWGKEISDRDESEFRSKKLYLYYTQKGKCMYTGKPIDLQDLFNDNLYDIDHIYPRHFVKDDSIENNLVLVKKQVNAHKSDQFPLEKTIQEGCRKLWSELRAGGFITEEKYRRLTRTVGFTEDERAAFISRQLVETRQGTKVITDLFKKTFPESDIVYVKAGNVSSFRQKYKFLKCRAVNDFHHAQDAYLNIVVGNVYYVKFTQNPFNFIREYDKAPNKNPYHMDKIFDYRVERNGKVAWEKESSIRQVREMMAKNTPLVTKRNFEVHGGFADQQIRSAQEAAKAKGKGYMPVKVSEERLSDVSRYGGFKKITGAYFCLVEHNKKGTRIRTLEAIPLYLKGKLDTKEKVEEYLRESEGLEEPDVRMMKIKMYSLIKVDGFYLYLTGRSNDQLLVCNAVQLVLPVQQVNYVREIIKAHERKYSENDLERTDIITREKNIELYEVLLDKHLHYIYCKRPNSVGEKLEQWEEEFVKLNLERQVYVLRQILQLSQLMNQGADLTYIGGGKKTGVATLNKEILKYCEFKLINQSVTGLYENEIDLLTV